MCFNHMLLKNGSVLKINSDLLNHNKKSPQKNEKWKQEHKRQHSNI